MSDKNTCRIVPRRLALLFTRFVGAMVGYVRPTTPSIGPNPNEQSPFLKESESEKCFKLTPGRLGGGL